MIALDAVTVGHGAFALRGVSLTVPAGGYAVLMGPTGCGKTTLLEATAGLRPVAAGRVLLRGADVTRQPPAARGLGYVPQDNALFAAHTVRGHLAFALELHRRPAAEIDARVKELAGRLGIDHLLGRRPAGLSGGEAKRVALGRALAARPGVLLLDEPLTGLDAETHGRLVGLLAELPGRGVTVLHVTHDRAEAEALASVRLRVEGGRVVRE